MKPLCPHPPSSENMRINFSKTFPRESLGEKEKDMHNECYLNIKPKCIREKIAFRKKENYKNTFYDKKFS
jgi:hypothetical protein